MFAKLVNCNRATGNEWVNVSKVQRITASSHHNATAVYFDDDQDPIFYEGLPEAIVEKLTQAQADFSVRMADIAMAPAREAMAKLTEI